MSEPPSRTGGELVEAAGRALAAGSPRIARWLCTEAVAAEPRNADAHRLLALAAEQEGDAGTAARHLLVAAGLTPGRDEPLLALAALRRAEGDDAGAAAALRAALAAVPADPDTWFDLGNAELSLGRLAPAIRAYRRALALKPGHRGASNNLALALSSAGAPAEALEAVEAGLALTPEADELWRLAAQLRLDTGDAEGAAAAVDAALALAPGVLDPELCRGVTTALRDRRRFEEAVALARRGIAIHPLDATLVHHLGVTLSMKGENEAAQDCFLQAVLLDPAHPFALNSLGVGLCNLGQAEAGVRALERALFLSPYHTSLHSNLALNLQYHPGVTAERILAVHRLWDERHGRRWLAPAPDPRANPFRRLRIGYVSPDLGQHPVGFFLKGVIANHDRGPFEVFCYSSRADEDPLTEFIRGHADHWIACASTPHEELLHRIRDDRIDILIDLAGHTQGNRLPVFAVKAAPVQATWAGYVGTTGLSAMDYLISDACQSPPGHDGRTAEAVVRLPDCYVCYDPPAYAPDVAPPPFRRNGFVTFGCFNNLAKVNDDVIAAWAGLLRGRPDRRLLMLTHALGTRAGRERVERAFAGHGVAADQLDLRPGAFHRQLLETYGEVDLALDPFPYSGGLTTLEASWMGVPVVTWAGERFCSRHSLSHLSAIGVPELAASDRDGYLALADALADDPARLEHYRRTLRPIMAASPLLDLPGFTRKLELALRRMWQRWCMLNA
ncbi:tetratricopeptide repeat protein [Arenibaculum sp.]|uniref:O-linked N-acetylglucosamine transferase family protein n=1 Tax=Arenibaculum sp. TaxID=2865862 RepID=UPI002E145CE6|nr:tetratricopeptide repeat protein [Arenibaculum sp.]